jgi:nicotinamidase-related amidase
MGEEETLYSLQQRTEERNNLMLQDEAKSSGALVVMDVQSAALAYTGEDPAFLKRLSNAIATARKAGMRVIHVTSRFREGYPEVSPHNRLFSRGLAGGFLPSADVDIHPAVAPQPGEVIVTKVRASAFSGSDFEVILRSQAISHLILCGIATSGVVLSTVLEAADKDYELTVLSDGCADADEEVQRVLLTKIFPRYAQVITVEEGEQKWSKPPVE